MAFIMATESDAYKIGNKKSGTPSNKLLRYSDVINFHCQCVDRSQSYNQIVRYDDLSCIPDTDTQWAVFWGIFDGFNQYQGGYVSTDFQPLCLSRPNECVVNDSNFGIDNFRSKYTEDNSLKQYDLVKFLEDYGGCDTAELSHYLFYHPTGGCPDYGSEIDEYWESSIFDTDSIQNTNYFTDLRELGFVGWNIKNPGQTFINAPDNLQILELGAGYSYVMVDPDDNKYTCTIQAQDAGGQYLNWYDADNYPSILCKLTDDGTNDPWGANGTPFWYDHVPHLIDLGDNIWRTNILNIDRIIWLLVDHDQSVISEDGTHIEKGVYNFEDVDIPTEQIPDHFEIQQGHPFTTEPSAAQVSSWYVDNIFEMFKTVLERKTFISPMAGEGYNGINIPLDCAEYVSPGSEYTPVAYTLCAFMGDSSSDAMLRPSQGYDFYGAATVFDWDQNAIRQGAEVAGIAPFYLVFNPDWDDNDKYNIIYTPTSWPDILNCTRQDIENPETPTGMVYSLYITIGHPDASIGNQQTGFEHVEPQDELFPTTFRIDFGPGFRSSIFYATWRHPFNEIKFG